jgi:exosortase A
MHPEPQIQSALSSADKGGPAWAAVFAVLACALIVPAWYRQTALSMVDTWTASRTFTHGFLVPPLFAFLVWREREGLARVEWRPWPPALVLLAVAGFVWLLGRLAMVAVVEQLAMVAMTPCLIALVLGPAALRTLVFALAFLFFAVPFGEFLVPRLMAATADFVHAAVRLSGVPIYREGNELVLPNGRWSVVEACSGIRYLIASVMGGVIFARFTYRSWRRRLAFVAFSILLPVVANWLRAYLIVMLGHLSDNRLAADVDHLIYGWLFFGVVILIMFWVGSLWSDRDEASTTSNAAPMARTSPPQRTRRVAAAAAAILVMGMWKPAYSLLTKGDRTAIAQLPPGVAGRNGWEAAAAPLLNFKPRYINPAAELSQTFSRDGTQVGLYIAYYRGQTRDRELVNQLNTLLPEERTKWTRLQSGTAAVRLASEEVKVRTAALRGMDATVIAWQWYWVGSRLTANDYFAKAHQVVAQLRGAGDDAAAVVLFTAEAEWNDGSAEVLRGFAADMWPSIEAALQQARGGR